jgi:hypothetical protein
MCAGVIWHAKGRGSVLASQSVNGFVFVTRSATERSCVNDHVPVYEASRGVNARVHFRVLELKVK